MSRTHSWLLLWAAIVTPTSAAEPDYPHARALTDRTFEATPAHEDAFIAVMRTGKAGSLDPAMPWAAFRGLSDDDLAAIYAALGQAVPVAPSDLERLLGRYRSAPTGLPPRSSRSSSSVFRSRAFADPRASAGAPATDLQSPNPHPLA